MRGLLSTRETALFRARAEPLSAVAVAAVGSNTSLLAEKLCRFSDDHLKRFCGVRTREAMVVLGPGSSLPWFDGALYLGAVGALLMPTWAEPVVHPALLEKALRKNLPSGPLAVVLLNLGETGPLVIPLSSARPLSRPRLTR